MSISDVSRVVDPALSVGSPVVEDETDAKVQIVVSELIGHPEEISGAITAEDTIHIEDRALRPSPRKRF